MKLDSRTGEAETGVGTVLMVGVGMSALLLLTIVILFAQASVAASRAATAADLSALAAADAARGLRDGVPCEVASEVAGRHGARLTACLLQGEAEHIVQVATAVESTPILPPAEGRARAGPPSEPAGR
ncbi:Rv3654c family TadE-like protein [Arthrobacter tecti]